jgi:Fungal specific transcription factor domain
VTGIDSEIQPSQTAATSQIQNRMRSDYYGYLRRLPYRKHCEVLLKFYFAYTSDVNVILDEITFREQWECWWKVGYDILLNDGPEKLPAELRCFPALIFQILAIALLSATSSYDPCLDELKFGQSQTFAQLSREYSECGEALVKLLGRMRLTFTGVQHSFMRDWWLVNTGDIMQAWNHSGQTVKYDQQMSGSLYYADYYIRDAIAIGLHIEPEVPSSSQLEELLDALWTNEIRKRLWLNIFCWDRYDKWFVLLILF